MIHPEFRYGKPQIDFLLEVKRGTLRVNSVDCFRDEPVERIVLHSQELTPAQQAGGCCWVACVIQIEGTVKARPNGSG